MTLKDVSNGPEWIIWIVFALLAVISILLLSGHGENLIAGYNTASKEDRNKYDAKKLCRVTGAGMAVITLMVLIMAVWENVLPASFVKLFIAVTFADCIIIIVLSNTICRK